MSTHVYREVVGVSADKRRLAASVARDAAKLLGLPPVTVRFFRRDESKQAAGDGALNLLGVALGLSENDGCWLDAPGLLGCAWKREPTTVWVNAALTPPELVSVLAHEIRHRWQFVKGWQDADARERDADRWADLFMALLAAAGR